MMSLDIYALGHGLIWLAQMCYVLCLVPQIIKNIKVGNTAGMHDVMLFGLLNGYFAAFYYIFCLGLPYAYKVVNTVQFFALLGLVFQRIHYDSTTSYKRIEYCLWGNSALALFFIPLAMNDPLSIGSIAGWITAGLFSISYIGKVFRIFATKSVFGFSILFVIIMALGVVLELIAANILGLPSQTIVSLWRALVVCSIFLFQFWLYS